MQKTIFLALVFMGRLCSSSLFAQTQLPLDSTFGTAGVYTYVAGGYVQDVVKLLVLPNDQLLVFSQSNLQTGGGISEVTKLRTDGTLDTGFGQFFGRAAYGTNQGGIPGSMRFWDATLDAQNHILITGYYALPGCSGCGYNFFVLKLQPNGRRDSTFGTDGFVSYNLRGPVTQILAEATSIALQTDGKIVVAGSYGSFVTGIFVARLLTTGQLDSTFSNDGYLTKDMETINFNPAKVGLQSDGKIVVGATYRKLGQSSPSGISNVMQFGVLRLLPDGTPDPDFGNLAVGLATYHYQPSIGGFNPSIPGPMVVMPDDRIMMAGSVTQDEGTGDFLYGYGGLRITPNGQPDSLFQVPDGIGAFYFLTTGSENDEGANSLLIDEAGNSYVGGYSYRDINGVSGFGLVHRRLANGSPDTTFGDRGLVYFQVAGVQTDIRQMAFNSKKELIIAGKMYSQPQAGFYVTAYQLPGISTRQETLYPEVSYQVFPNPAQETLHLRFAEAHKRQVRLFDMQGRVVMATQTSSDLALKLDVANLSEGVYLLQIQDLSFGRLHTSRVIIAP